MRIPILLAALFAFPILGSEAWLCTEAASQIRGSTILVCGIGESRFESLARAKALLAAKAEFRELCGTACSQYKMEPKRTTCSREGKDWKCYRGIEYTVDFRSSETTMAIPTAITPARNAYTDIYLKYMKTGDF